MCIHSRRNPNSVRSGRLPVRWAGAVDPRGFPAGSDGRLISRLLKSPTVIFGPGDVTRIHKIDEAVELAEVSARARALEKFLSSGID